jgi:tetratricopeptide (TPR) repeat protein
LTRLGQVWISQKNWAKVAGATQALQNIGTPDALANARGLQAAELQSKGNLEAAITFLQSELDQDGSDTGALAQIIQAQALAGKFDEARSLLDGALAKTPNDGNLQLLSAGLSAAQGKFPEAEAGFRKVIADYPNSETAPARLYELLRAAGRTQEASATLETAVQAHPRSTTLRWMLASEYQLDGKIPEAIAIYDALYAENSANVVIANNLASLLTTFSNDPANLQRADAVARRLRGSDVPAFQDTYGWIEYLKGNYSEALSALEPAAKGLPDDAGAQVHLGLTYAALGQTEKAKLALTRGLELAGDDPSQQFEMARKALADLPAAP